MQAGNAGNLSGMVIAPITAAVSALRNSRMFHPSGILCQVVVENVADDLATQAVARRLGTSALMRLSSAWWKGRDWPDVLGCALRFSSDVSRVEPLQGDQDLLFATIRRPWTLPFAPLTTRYEDFLSNHYYAVSPFREAALGRIEWRLVPEAGETLGAHREERLRRRVEAGTANFRLEWAPYRPPFAAFDERAFRPLLRLRTVAIVDLDQERLRFDPFQNGRGIIPVGFIHGLRRATYASSQRARPKSALDAQTEGRVFGR